LNSKLYLCGTPSTNEDASSYLFQITFQTLHTKIMVSSQYGHYYPSLISINNNKILCVGGKKQRQCEIYDIIINHWSPFPELPEERYKCTLCFNYKNKHLYLFGGINNKNNFLSTDSNLFHRPATPKNSKTLRNKSEKKKTLDNNRNL